jgi:hypothetical protein
LSGDATAGDPPSRPRQGTTRDSCAVIDDGQPRA